MIARKTVLKSGFLIAAIIALMAFSIIRGYELQRSNLQKEKQRPYVEAKGEIVVWIATIRGTCYHDNENCQHLAKAGISRDVPIKWAWDSEWFSAPCGACFPGNQDERRNAYLKEAKNEKLKPIYEKWSQTGLEERARMIEWWRKSGAVPAFLEQPGAK